MRKRQKVKKLDIEDVMKYRGYRPWWVKDFATWLKSHWDLLEKKEDIENKEKED